MGRRRRRYVEGRKRKREGRRTEGGRKRRRRGRKRERHCISKNYEKKTTKMQ